MDSDLDFIDLKILEILQRDGRASHSAIAEAVGLSQPSVHERVKKLEQRGVIKGYAALVDPEALGLDVLAYISVRLSDYKPDDIANAVAGIPEVLETHHIAGEECFIVKVRCRTNKQLQDILQRIWQAGPVTASKTTIAFATFKETTALPLPAAEPHKERRSA
ncbi:MAG TPA: Lrp/AsnC family transcriptional regulator [Dehalococcoidia bacterium]|jgi:Lrp/AsnC family leucine-responsive transcriptional regulator|nr:Lrp/AsnC family transcriptional regulator [Dehalococcoidia bacterium]